MFFGLGIILLVLLIHCQGLKGNSWIETEISRADEACVLLSNGKSVQLKVFLSATNAFIPVLLNWLIYWTKHCNTSSILYLLCLDDQIDRNLRQYGLSCSHTQVLPTQAAHNRLWMIRTRLTYELLLSRIDVLITDLDALWLRDPFLSLSQHYSDSSIIASRAKFPEGIAEVLGATLCMGFIYIKSSNETIAFWKELSETVSRTQTSDDQRAINEMLLRSNIDYGDRIKFYKNTIVDRGRVKFQGKYDLNVTLLPQHLFRRHCDVKNPQPVRESIVAHCSTMQRNDNRKRVALTSYGLWSLSDDWKSRTKQKNESFSVFIKSLIAS